MSGKNVFNFVGFGRASNEARNTSFMSPHFGHFPGRLRLISGCIEQVYFLSNLVIDSSIQDHSYASNEPQIIQ
jgi:hypothetical protein